MDLQGPSGQEVKLELSNPSARLFWLPAMVTGIFNVEYLEPLEIETAEYSTLDQTSPCAEHSAAEQIYSLPTGDLQYHGPFLHTRDGAYHGAHPELLRAKCFKRLYI